MRRAFKIVAGHLLSLFGKLLLVFCVPGTIMCILSEESYFVIPIVLGALIVVGALMVGIGNKLYESTINQMKGEGYRQSAPSAPKSWHGDPLGAPDDYQGPHHFAHPWAVHDPRRTCLKPDEEWP